MEKYLIFALARTGSTSLMNIMNVNKSIKLFSEPFNKHNVFFTINKEFSKLGQKPITGIEDLKEELEILVNEYGYNGLKHVWQPSGFPFQQNVSLNQEMLSLFDYVIFLNRKNILKRIISGFISDQTKVWEVSKWKKGQDKMFVENYEYEPIELRIIEWFIKMEKSYREKYRNELIDKGIKFYEIDYEDLFEDDVTMENKIEKCLELFRFLNQSAEFSDKEMEEIKTYLGENLRLNSINTYLKIPNIQEIEEKFGSEENGYLLKVV